MAVKTGHRVGVRKSRKRQRSGSSPLSSMDETDNGRRRVRRLPKIKGGELLEVTVLASRKGARRSRRPITKKTSQKRL